MKARKKPAPPAMEVDLVMTDADGLDSEGDLVREEAVLARRLRVLEDHVKTNLPEHLPPLAERCRSLREKIGRMEEIIRRAKSTPVSREDVPNVPGNGTLSNWNSLHTPITSNTLSEFDSSSPAIISYDDSCISHTDFEFNIGGVVFARDYHPTASIHSDSKRSGTDAKERNPCLRCKILKRKCDSFEQCSLCPQQSNENEHDYWKVLGCFRSSLKEISEYLIPAHSIATMRSFKSHNGQPQPFQVTQKYPRTFDHVTIEITHFKATSSFDLANTQDYLWDSIESRKKLCQDACDTTVQDLGDVGRSYLHDTTLQVLHAPWSLLRVVNVEAGYGGKTGYNPFTLLRLGGLFSRNHPAEWKIFSQVQRLIPAVAELYLAERFIVDRTLSDASAISLSGSSDLVIIDIRRDIEGFLKYFELICSHRGKLTGQKQLACLYAIISLSIVKNLMVDAYSLRSLYDADETWKDSDAVRIHSSYKALVSVFCWSSKSDLLLEGANDEDNSTFQRALEDTRAMLRVSQWTQLGIKGFKEFLLSLGSNFLPDGVFNGFFIQKFGAGKMEHMSSKPWNEAKDVSEMTSDAPLASTDYSPSEYLLDLTSTRFEVPTSLKAPSKNFKNSRPNWENVVVVKSGLSFVENDHSPAPQRSGIRKGKLHPEIARKAQAMRRRKACWSCWINKTPCSFGDVCDRCLKQGRDSSLPMPICSRSGFKDYESTFFPEFLHSHLKKPSIEDFINENTERFTDKAYDINISLDGLCSMIISVNSFEPRSSQPSHQYWQQIDGRQQEIKFIPIGVLGLDLSNFKTKAARYLDAVLAQALAVNSAKDNSGSTIANETMKVLLRFSQVGNPDLTIVLKQCLAVYSIVTFMRRLPVLVGLSASQVVKETTDLSEADVARVHASSHLLDLQIKYVMNRLARETVPSILERLEKSIRTRTRDSWFVSFPAILLICLCIEELQIAVVTGITTQMLDGKDPSSRNPKEIAEACSTLEQYPFQTITDVFHLVYRTSKEGGGFNPLKESVMGTDKPDSDVNTNEALGGMIRGMGRIITSSYAELQAFNTSLDTTQSPEDFIKRNSGRLVSKFLLSFIDETAVPTRASQ